RGRDGLLDERQPLGGAAAAVLGHCGAHRELPDRGVCVLRVAPYVSRLGRVLIDRELYLPASWTDDRDRCRAAYIPDEVGFATKPAQAKVMLERVLAAGGPFRRVSADDAPAQYPGPRARLSVQDR